MNSGTEDILKNILDFKDQFKDYQPSILFTTKKGYTMLVEASEKHNVPHQSSFLLYLEYCGIPIRMYDTPEMVKLEVIRYYIEEEKKYSGQPIPTKIILFIPEEMDD